MMTNGDLRSLPTANLFDQQKGVRRYRSAKPPLVIFALEPKSRHFEGAVA
jgi:hypothetical protein